MSPGKVELSFEVMDRSTHFVFEHKVFAVEGARFGLTADSNEPAFYVTLGKLNAALKLSAVRHEFGIAPDSPDGKLLAIVENSLRYVKEIRPGDSIPRELLDGTASWRVEERHRQRAERRFTIQIAAPERTKEAAALDDAALGRLCEDPQVKARLAAALEELAERLGLAPGKSREVRDRLDKLVREFAYIEALRDRFALVRGVVDKTEMLARACRGDRTMVQDVSRVRTLLLRPVDEMERIFAEVYAGAGEIAGVLRMLDAHLPPVRRARDELHARLMPWDDVVTRWQNFQPVRGPAAEAALRHLYQFAAQHFAQRQNW